MSLKALIMSTPNCCPTAVEPASPPTLQVRWARAALSVQPSPCTGQIFSTVPTGQCTGWTILGKKTLSPSATSEIENDMHWTQLQTQTGYHKSLHPATVMPQRHEVQRYTRAHCGMRWLTSPFTIAKRYPCSQNILCSVGNLGCTFPVMILPRNMRCDEVVPGTVQSLSTGPANQNSIAVVQPILPILCHTVIHCDGHQCLRFIFFCAQASLACMAQHAQHYPQHQ